MKNTKRTNDTEALTVNMAPKQTTALREIEKALGDDQARATAKVLSVGLFVLGLDRAGSFCLSELTDALHGERAGEVYNQIADAGLTATDARVDVEYDERRRMYGTAVEVNA